MKPRCFEAFCDSGFSGKNLQILIDTMFPGFACEAESCSPFSPGPVEHGEEIGFLLINPLHYDEQRETVIPDAFQELLNRDLSVIRAKYSSKTEAQKTKDELIRRGADRIPPKLRLIEEVCISSVSSVRESIETYGQILGVFDTALEDKRGHASIFTKKEALQKGPLRKKVRERIHAVMTKRVEPFATFIEKLPD